MYEVKQFKLLTGEEIVAEIVEWADEEFGPEIIVRNALQIDAFYKEDPPFDKYYAFKPYLHCVDGNMDFIIINSEHVTATAIPHEELLESYIEARHRGHEISNERRAEKEYQKNLKLKEASEQLRRILEEGREEVAVETKKNEDNVVQFPSKTDDEDPTVH